MEEPRHQQKVTLLVQRQYILPLLFLADLLFAENLILLSDAKMKLFFSPTAQKISSASKYEMLSHQNKMINGPEYLVQSLSGKKTTSKGWSK